MRFICEHCGKRYLTKDVLEPGRVYRTRCKACGSPITLRGGAEAGAGVPGAAPPAAQQHATSSTAVTSLTPPAPTPPPSPAAQPPLRATPPTAPRSGPPPRLTPPSVPPPPAPRAAPSEPRYVDLFEGEEMDDLLPPAAPAPVEVTPAPRIPEMRDFEAPTRAIVRVPQEPSPARSRAPLAYGVAAAGVIAILLSVGAVWRPWMTTTRTSRAPALPATLPTPAAAAAPHVPPPPTAEPPATPPPAAEPPAALPPAVEPTPPPAAPPAAAATATDDGAAKQEQERARADRLDKARQAREEKERAKAERRERERQAREEKAERERVARAEKERARAEKLEKLEQARLARLEPAPTARPARLDVAPPPPPPAEARGLSPEAIQGALASGRKALEACFRDQARGIVPPVEASQVTLRFLVQPGGAVTSPEVADEKVAATAAGQCLKTAAAGLQFPAFKGEPARVEAPVRVPPAPPGGRLLAVEFTGPQSARGGGDVGDTLYSERTDDAKITDRTFADGVVTYAGQVGMGQGSKYAGIGMNVNMFPGSPARAIDATRFKAMSIRLAATGTRSLRVRIIGADETTRNNGCYPVTIVRVTPEVKEYVLRFSSFDPENYCGSKGRSVAKTLPELQGFEIADANMDREPVTFSTGSIVLLP